MNAWCEEPWRRGYTLDLVDDCKADDYSEDPCLSFNSASIMESQNFTNTLTLSPGQVCNVYLDASAFILHASFWATSSTNDDSEVGILYNGVGPGDFIEVTSPKILEL